MALEFKIPQTRPSIAYFNSKVISKPYLLSPTPVLCLYLSTVERVDNDFSNRKELPYHLTFDTSVWGR